jgi:hypothetical protein
MRPPISIIGQQQKGLADFAGEVPTVEERL